MASVAVELSQIEHWTYPLQFAYVRNFS